MTDNHNLFNPEGTSREQDLLAAFGNRQIVEGVDFHPVNGQGRRLHVDAEFHQAPPQTNQETPTVEPTFHDVSNESQPVGASHSVPLQTEHDVIVQSDNGDWGFLYDEKQSPYRQGDIRTLRTLEALDDDDTSDHKEWRQSTKWAAASLAGLALVGVTGTIAQAIYPMPWAGKDSTAASATKLSAPNVVTDKQKKKSNRNVDSTSKTVSSEPLVYGPVIAVPPESTPTVPPSPTEVPVEVPTELTPVAPVPTETTVVVPPTDIRVGTLNIFHSDDQSPTVWKEERLRRTVNAIKGLPGDSEWFKPLDPSKALSVAGLQEVRPNQQEFFLKDNFAGKDYDMYPRLDRNQYFSPNPIIWQTAQFDLVKTDTVRFRYFGGVWLESPAVLLESKTTAERAWFMNVHYPADVHGEADIYRHENDAIYLDKVNQLRHSGNTKVEADDKLTPVVLLGDFNTASAYNGQNGNNPLGGKLENLSVCALTNSGVLRETYLALTFPDADPKNCGTQVPEINTVDHIFSTSEFAILGYAADKGPVQVGSDFHSLHVAELQLPGYEITVPVDPVVVETPVATPTTTPEVSK